MIWQETELRVYPELFCTPCQISSINKRDRSKLLKSKAPFKWFLMDIISATSPNVLTDETTLSKYILTLEAYSKMPKLYSTERITSEGVMDKFDMFQYIFGKIYGFGWWDLENNLSRYRCIIYLH